MASASLQGITQDIGAFIALGGELSDVDRPPGGLSGILDVAVGQR